MVNKGIHRWASGGPFSESRENSPSDLDYSGPPKKGRRKKSTFVSIIQTIATPLLVDTSPGAGTHFSLGVLDFSSPEPKERVLRDLSTLSKDHISDSSASPPCPAWVLALHTGSG